MVSYHQDPGVANSRLHLGGRPGTHSQYRPGNLRIHSFFPPRTETPTLALGGNDRLERALFSRWMQWLTSGGSDASNKRMFVEALDIMDEELTRRGGPYFLGDEFSLVDITFTPFLERMVARCAQGDNALPPQQGLRRRLGNPRGRGVG